MNRLNKTQSVGLTVLTTDKCLKAQLMARRRRRLRAQTTVEFALIMPFVCFMLMAIVEFGWLIKNMMTMTNAVRETARFASLGLSTNDIAKEATNVATPLTLTAVTMQQSSDNGTTWTSFPTNNISGTSTNNGVASGNLIKITLSANNSQLTNFVPQLNHFVITQNAIMTRE